MAYLSDMIDCCGILELGNIASNRSPERMLGELYYPPQAAHVFFSDPEYTSYKHGEALAAYILKENLGSVVEIPPARNPNTNHLLKMWVWTPNPAAVTEYIEGRDAREQLAEEARRKARNERASKARAARRKR